MAWYLKDELDSVDMNFTDVSVMYESLNFFKSLNIKIITGSSVLKMVHFSKKEQQVKTRGKCKAKLKS